ncbi:MAG: tetraacyldisaccharide 4'-kinase, partial [candidate division FCPU426 bacterium]
MIRKIEQGWESLIASQGLAWSLLLPFSYVYGLASRLLRLGPGQKVVGLSVVSVGNLSVGGAGKTPLVMAIAAHYLRKGHRPAILTRGYGGDEPQMLRQALPGVRVFVGADRLALAQQARAAGCDQAILDDGFQRRHQLARDLDILVL